jgi:hypothetical protein
MEQYFFKITASYTSKNKLYEEFNAYIHSLDGTLIKDEGSLANFIFLIRMKLQDLNEKYSRCKPVCLLENRYGGIGLRVEGSWSASFYKVEQAVEMVDGFLQTFIK